MITNRTFAWLAVAAMAFAVYVSLMPFNLRAVPFGAALEQFTFVVTTPTTGRVSRTNFLANLLLFVPIGFALAGALLVDRRWQLARLARAVTIALGGALLVSLTAEFLQIFAPGRVPARSDIEAQAVGCLAGITAWLVAGQWLTGWLRAAPSRSGTGRAAKVLTAYAAVWIVVNLAPFDFTFDLGELAQRVRSGLITVMPFAGMARPTSRMVWDVVISVLSAIPLGALGGTAASHHGRRRVGRGVLVGGAIVLGVEAVQVFIASHAADGTDVLSGWLGVVAGACVSARLLAAHTASQAAVPRDAGRRWSGWLLAAWCGVLLMYHWMPYDFSFDPALIRRQAGGPVAHAVLRLCAGLGPQRAHRPAGQAGTVGAAGPVRRLRRCLGRSSGARNRRFRPAGRADPRRGRGGSAVPAVPDP